MSLTKAQQRIADEAYDFFEMQFRQQMFDKTISVATYNGLIENLDRALDCVKKRAIKREGKGTFLISGEHEPVYTVRPMVTSLDACNCQSRKRFSVLLKLSEQGTVFPVFACKHVFAVLFLVFIERKVAANAQVSDDSTRSVNAGGGREPHGPSVVRIRRERAKSPVS